METSHDGRLNETTRERASLQPDMFVQGLRDQQLQQYTGSLENAWPRKHRYPEAAVLPTNAPSGQSGHASCEDPVPPRCARM